MRDWRALLAAAVWLVLSVLLWAVGSEPAAVALAGIVAVIAALVVLLTDLVDVVVPVTWPRQEDDRREVRPPDRCLRPLRNQLDSARRFGSTEIHDTLVALVAQRAAPGRPLPPSLAALVAGPPRPITSARELRQIITDIEAL